MVCTDEYTVNDNSIAVQQHSQVLATHVENLHLDVFVQPQHFFSWARRRAE